MVSFLRRTLLLLLLVLQYQFSYGQSSTVAHWTFDPTSGSVLADISGNGNDGTITGATWDTGLKGGALRFDGIDDKVEVPHNPQQNVSAAVTIEAILMPTGPQTSGVFVPIVSKGAPGSPNEIHLFISPDNVIYASLGGTNRWITAQTPLVVNQWHHVVALFDGSNNRIYINNVLDIETTNSGTIGNSSYELQIGGADAGEARGTFNGLLDEVRISNVGLSPDDFLEFDLTPRLFPVAESAQVAGSTFWLDVEIGDTSTPVAGLFGTSFILNYDATYLSVIETEVGTLMGEDVLSTINSDTPGKVGAGITRKAGEDGISGNGTVLRVQFLLDVDTPAETNLTFSLSDVQSIKSSSELLNLELETLEVQVLACVAVWPGDTNNDGVVGVADVLPLGTYWNFAGPVRPNASLQWTKQCNATWDPEPSTFADANGNGVVDQADILPIGFNHGQTHSTTQTRLRPVSPVQLAMNTGNPLQLSLFFHTPIHADDTYWVDVLLEDAVNLFGVAFELHYTPAENMIALDAEADAWFGDDVITFSHIDTTRGVVSFGVTRKAGQEGLEGTGRIARIKMKMEAPDGNATDMIFNKIIANDPTGQHLEIYAQNRAIVTSTETRTLTLPENYALGQNYPNPFNPTTMITYNLPESKHITLTIYDALGRTIVRLVDGLRTAGTHQVRWDASHVSNGVYLYQLATEDYTETRRMILAK